MTKAATHSVTKVEPSFDYSSMPIIENHRTILY